MKVKIFPPVLKGIEEALTQIFDEGYYADKVIERQFKSHPKWGGRDRRAVAECTYEVVRHYLSLKLLLERLEVPFSYRHLSLLWIEVFQDQFEVGAESLFSSKKQRVLDEYEKLEPWQKHSIPKWIDDLMLSQRGEREWSELRATLNEQAPVFLRANELKTSAKQLCLAMQAEGYDLEVVDREALRLIERKNVFSSKSFKEGLFEVQDLHSQKVVEALDPQPGETVIDACAGAGGKSLQISSRMKNKGKVISLDILENKLAQLKKRARRAGVHNLEMKVIDSSKVIKRLEKRADRLLLDVPCSGLGVLRRNPDTKWKLTPERVSELEEIQIQILSNYTSMLKPGGILVYSTCSLLPSENTLQIQRLLKKSSDFELQEEFELFPGIKKGDGFYIAKLLKK